MATDRQTDIQSTVERILTERLEQYNVPSEVRNEIRKEILAFMQRPEKKPYGAAVMTPEASMAADQARKRGKAEPGDAKPQII